MVGIVATIPMLAKTLQAGIGAKMQCLLFFAGNNKAVFRPLQKLK